MQNKILVFISLVLVAGGIFYFVVNPVDLSHTSADPFAGLTIEVAPVIASEKIAVIQKEVVDLTADIVTKEAAGKYDLDVYFNRAADYQRLGQLKLAFLDFTKVVAGDPGNETAWNNLGDLRIAMGDVNGAENYYEKSIEQDPSAVAYNKLYNYYMQYRTADRMDAIEPLLKETLAKAGPDSSVYVKLARWYLSTNQKAQAIAAYQQAYVLSPTNAAIKTELDKAQAM